ncbi:hypothetical protein EJ08DRAFT_691327 [Tothia fuscella]|uniref:Uncharacterized protein n=1 Tax=Tothia fuscella TaxID=1048955 RepID=A0A9P4P529_9PEZI|nr:hypothetical protein EJ08DRAFT_691327 [Tothia fuscella]
MSLTTPYSNDMQLGQGFNTYTAESRISGAVKFVPKSTVTASSTPNGAKDSTFKDNTNSVFKSPGSNETFLQAVPDTSTLPTVSTGQRAPVIVAFQTANGEEKPPATAADSFKNGELVTRALDTIFKPGTPKHLPFTMPSGEITNPSQSVTFSTRSIDNMSDIMDLLNISASMSIKYGTIHGNGNASFVNESKVLDSALNYVVSVQVNNNSPPITEEMVFQPLDEVPADKFTEVFGDSFISGFVEGGSFNAVISVDVHDKSKLRHVKQAIDVALAIGPSPITMGGSESLDKEHSELLQDTEISISVNWTGGGEIKNPEDQWTVESVVSVANAFPSMVARCSAKTTAILSRYSSLRSFEVWRYKKLAETKLDLWGDKSLILNYAPCSIYTNDLFNAFMAYKKLWKRIDFILQDMSKWKAKEPPKLSTSPKNLVPPSYGRAVSLSASPIDVAKRDFASMDAIVDGEHENPNRPSGSPPPLRAETFAVDDPYIYFDFDINDNNAIRDPIRLDPVELNEAKVLCREALTLITEEAARLVNHPELAYAQFDERTGKTKMKRPIYAYPEVLKARLPIFIRNDASDDTYSGDAAVQKVKTYTKNDDLFSHLVGDVANPYRKYTAFVSLDFNEGTGPGNTLCGISLHTYHHHSMSRSRFSMDAAGAIGGIGFQFASDKDDSLKADNCAHHFGKPRFEAANQYHHLHIKEKNKPEIEITKIIISYIPGSGRIAGIEFFDKLGDASTRRLFLTQWSAAGREPQGLKKVAQEPPADGSQWKLVGMMGDFDHSIWGSVLARVSGIWRRT